LRTPQRRRREAVVAGEVEHGRLASVGFAISPVSCSDKRAGKPGSRSFIYSSTRLLRTAALCPAQGRTGGWPHQRVSQKRSWLCVNTGTSRISTPAPELVIVDFVAQHAIEPQDELAGHGDDRDRRIFLGGKMKVEAAEIFIAADGLVSGFQEQETQQAVALFGYVAETLGIATGMFLGIESAERGDASRAIETGDGFEGMNDGKRSEQADAGMSAQASHARVVLGALLKVGFDGSDLLGESREQGQRVLALDGKSTGERKSGEALLAGDGEEFGAKAQAVAESDGLQAIAQHSTNANQAVAVAQQREHFAAGRRRNMDGGKLAVTEKIEQQLGIATIVFLPTAGELADSQGVTDQQLVTEFCGEAMEPQRITGSFHADERGSRELRIKRTDIVTLVIEHGLVFLAICGVEPAEGLRADMQINSDVHCHLRLLFKPKPNDSGREYQLSPQEARVS
jgi:hypothetical protein